MKIDTTITTGLGRMAEDARAAEEAGYSGIWTFEGAHDPFLPLLLAAEHTERVELGTSIAVAFARNPLLIATVGWDLQAYSRGRFILGLGSQIRAHITRRYSMPWSRPADRMRDMVLAVRAIWETWEHGGRLDHHGEFYQHTLMPPLFRPAAAEVDGFGPPPIYLAGVGPHMTRVAGEVADGFMSHPFCTPEFLRTVTLPMLAEGAAVTGKRLDEKAIHHSVMIATGNTAEDVAAARRAIRKQLAFYGSTQAYWPILELHDRGELGPRLKELSKQGEWDRMTELIDDEFLDAVAVTVDDPADAAAQLHRRYDGLVGRLGFSTPYQVDSTLLEVLMREFLR
ncbi:TIGR03617 family F420-dependent LLM class oxidoreductase [Antrihabitans stalactiti]